MLPNKKCIICAGNICSIGLGLEYDGSPLYITSDPQYLSYIADIFYDEDILIIKIN